MWVRVIELVAAPYIIIKKGVLLFDFTAVLVKEKDVSEKRKDALRI